MDEDLVVSKTGSAEADLGHAKSHHFDMILANAVIKTAFAELKAAVAGWYGHLAGE